MGIYIRTFMDNAGNAYATLHRGDTAAAPVAFKAVIPKESIQWSIRLVKAIHAALHENGTVSGPCPSDRELSTELGRFLVSADLCGETGIPWELLTQMIPQAKDTETALDGMGWSLRKIGRGLVKGAKGAINAPISAASYVTETAFTLPGRTVRGALRGVKKGFLPSGGGGGKGAGPSDDSAPGGDEGTPPGGETQDDGGDGGGDDTAGYLHSYPTLQRRHRVIGDDLAIVGFAPLVAWAAQKYGPNAAKYAKKNLPKIAKADKLISRATAGDKGAQKQLAGIHQLAKAGNPAGKDAAKAVAVAAAARNEGVHSSAGPAWLNVYQGNE